MKTEINWMKGNAEAARKMGLKGLVSQGKKNPTCIEKRMKKILKKMMIILKLFKPFTPTFVGNTID